MAKEPSAFEKKLADRVRASRERLENVECIDDLRPQLTMRRIKLHLEPRVISSEEIQRLREAFNISQGVLAAFIQVPPRTLQEWEQGRSPVTGCASKLLAEMLRDPEYWTERLNEAFEKATTA